MIKAFKYLLAFYSLTFAFPISGQICSGNLGENIFTYGDFGSGNTNVVSTDPQIAPGYNYEPHPPPDDGSYTIANYTGYWNLFPGWIKIYDNSPDKFGYMMIINASNEPGLFYEKEITGLCDNTLYEFSADIINLLNTGANMIKPNASFLLDDEVKYSTGDIPENEQWLTYGFTFTTGTNQSSVKLSLMNNAPGGMGNDLALDNISFRPCGPEALILPVEITNICEDGNPINLEATLIGDSYETPFFQWQTSYDEGISWIDIDGETSTSYTHDNFSGGYYYYRYLVANGDVNLSNYKCRVVSNVKIVHVIPKFVYIFDTICQGLTYTVGNSQYTSTGLYIDSLVNTIGCDSIITLDLTITIDQGIYSNGTIENPSCSYTNNGSFSLDTIYNGSTPYTFLFEDVQYGLDETISNLPGGEYIYSITDKNGCSFKDTIIIESPKEFTINLGPDLQVELGDIIVLNPDPNFPVDNYTWDPTELIECNNYCEEVILSPSSSLIVISVARSTNNCITSDTLTIDVIKVRKAYFPNAFTPNNDGLNDYFTVFGSVPNIQKVEKMLIFDRWGKIIYEENDFIPNEPTAGWDGKYNGAILNSGSFVYIIDIRFLDNKVITYKGVVSLIK